MYNLSDLQPWKVRRMPGKIHVYQVCSYENPDAIEVLGLAWTDIKAAQRFADAANAMYRSGKKSERKVAS